MDTITNLIDKYQDNLPDGYDLVGVDGNAYAIMGYVKSALRKCRWSSEDINAVIAQMTASDYNNLIHVASRIIYAKVSYND